MTEFSPSACADTHRATDGAVLDFEGLTVTLVTDPVNGGTHIRSWTNYGLEPGTHHLIPKCLAERALIHQAATPDRSQWRPIETAPRDGTLILTWCVHANAEHCDDAVAEGYAGPVIAKWIDHNGGGFTWHGLAGKHTHWQPLPAAPEGV